MKKINKMSKFNSFYYIGMSVILGIVFLIVIILSVISGVIIRQITKNPHEDLIQKIENVKEVSDKKIVYDTIKVQIVDTVKVTPKKVKPVVINEEKNDSVN